ncbi:unnamed protein product, partial [Choristocarpus tenellus]
RWTKGGCLAFWQVKHTIRKAKIETWGYTMKTSRGRRDWCATILLSLVLVIVAVAVSGVFDSLHLVNVDTTLCTGMDEKLATNLEIMREVTNYTQAIAAKDSMMALMSETYFAARERYASGVYAWPDPYHLTAAERAELEAAAEDGGEECEYREVCAEIFGGCFGIGACKKCKWVRIPCPDVVAAETLLAYDASHQALDVYGELVDPTIAVNMTEVESFVDAATQAIADLLHRVNIASSVYVLYLAATLFIAPALVVYG